MGYPSRLKLILSAVVVLPLLKLIHTEDGNNSYSLVFYMAILIVLLAENCGSPPATHPDGSTFSKIRTLQEYYGGPNQERIQ